tara:strand:+ start:26 stop:256 length:231 start_codon:yes stop_codon:yes gene_type:complete
MNEAKVKCKNCDYFEANTYDEYWGYCKRYPTKHTYIVDGKLHEAKRNYNILANIDDFCGEFKPKGYTEKLYYLGEF